MYNLLTHAEKMRALVEEIRGSFTKVDDLTFEKLAELKYLNACKHNRRLRRSIP